MKRNGFTIVELLVVMAIIALLIAIAIPGMAKARIAAKRVATESLIGAIETGCEMFKSEKGLTSKYPISSPDSDDWTMQSPFPGKGGVGKVPATGAALLVLQLSGPDGNGTVRLRDINGKPSARPTWADDLPDLFYGETIQPRYGAYVKSDGATERLSSLASRNRYWLPSTPADTTAGDVQVYADKFSGPILYYRCRVHAQYMLTNDTKDRLGVVDFRDNAWFTGTTSDVHPIGHALYDGDANFGVCADPGRPRFDCYILDPNATQYQRNSGGDITSVTRGRPYNGNTFLLISAGQDQVFGTKDDIHNWGRK